MLNRDDPPPPFLGEDEAEADFQRAAVAILPVPYEATVSWMPGTARGPEMIRRASPYLEFFDEQMQTEPYRCGVWTSPPLTGLSQAPEQAREAIRERFGALMDQGKFVVMLGGEHSITPGGVQAALKHHPGLHVVQFDAHADLRESYHGSRWNHACAMARCVESVPVHAIGVRSYTADEAQRIRAGIPGYDLVHSWELEDPAKVDRWLAGLAGHPVYLTFDVDYFDPSIMPATGTPEPGGGAWFPTLAILERIFEAADVVACDVVELAPHPGLHHADFTAARLVHKIIGMWNGGRGHR